MKIKKGIYLIIISVFCWGLLSCTNEEKADLPKAGEDKETAKEVSSSTDKELDLTLLSSTMVYSEVYNIVYTPEDYIGRTIKMRGQYYYAYNEETEREYHFVLIDDAAACCQQGLEFIVKDENAYPKDGAEVEVTGVFESYDEDGTTYYRIAAEGADSITQVTETARK